MPRAERAQVVPDLIRLLKEERKALGDGDFETLSDLAIKKAALVDRLELDGTSAPALAKLKREATDLLPLLEAGQRGIAAARARLDAQQEARSGLTTYGPEGQNRTVGGATSRNDNRF